VQEGSFVLTSGLRSLVFPRKARDFMHVDKTETLCSVQAKRIRAEVAAYPADRLPPERRSPRHALR
jgi:orotate phosphoribosyltransferase